MWKTQTETPDAWVWILVLLPSSVTLRKLLNNQNLCFPISEMETWQAVSQTGPQSTMPSGIWALQHSLPHSASAHPWPDCMTKRRLTVVFWALKDLMGSALALGSLARREVCPSGEAAWRAEARRPRGESDPAVSLSQLSLSCFIPSRIYLHPSEQWTEESLPRLINSQKGKKQ